MTAAHTLNEATLEDQGQVPGYLQARATTGLGPKRLRYSHDAMIDLIIEQPDISQNAIAAAFGYTPAWVSVIMASDAFRERFAARRTELVDPELRESIQTRFKAIVMRSQEVLLEKLAAPAAQISDATLLKAMELGAKGAGVPGFTPAPLVAVQQQQPGEHLNQLAGRLTSLLRVQREEIEYVEEAILVNPSPATSPSPTPGGPEAGQG